MSAYRFSPMIELAATFPMKRGGEGANTTIADLDSYYRTHQFPPKSHAVQLITRAAQERVERRGKGTNAMRRLTRMEAEFLAAQDTLADRMAVEADAYLSHP